LINRCVVNDKWEECIYGDWTRNWGHTYWHRRLGHKKLDNLPSGLDPPYWHLTCLLLLYIPWFRKTPPSYWICFLDSLYQGLTQLLLASTSFLISLKSNFEKQVEEFSHWKICIDLCCLPYLLMESLSPWYFFFSLICL
jgi:hypothetical protein